MWIFSKLNVNGSQKCHFDAQVFKTSSYIFIGYLSPDIFW